MLCHLRLERNFGLGNLFSHVLTWGCVMMNAIVRPTNKNFTAHAVFERCATSIGHCFDDDPKNQRPMAAKLLSHNEKGLVARMEMNGQSLVVKAFDPENPDSLWNMARETKVLSRLSNTGLAARLVSINKMHQFLALEYLEGVPLADSLVESELPMICRKLGRWLASFNEEMPSQRTQSTWFDYLKHYREPALQKIVTKRATWLEKMPISELRIAKNDSFLHNFIISPNGEVLGVDFEASSIKPVGWDLLLTSRVLAQHFPHHINTITINLLQGWGKKVGLITAARFAKLCDIFARKTAFEPLGQNQFNLNKIMSDYNDARLTNRSLPQTNYVVKVPYMHQGFTSVTADEKEEFSSRLAKEACRAKKDLNSRQVSERSLDANIPSTLMQQACALCNGRCCGTGKKNNAFLKAEDLQRHFEKDEDSTIEDIVKLYINYMPDEHVLGSCLFHGKNGCSIPRHDRAQVCNKFLCDSAKLVGDLPRTAQDIDESTLLVSVRFGAVKRSKITVPSV